MTDPPRDAEKTDFFFAGGRGVRGYYLANLPIKLPFWYKCPFRSGLVVVVVVVIQF